MYNERNGRPGNCKLLTQYLARISKRWSQLSNFIDLGLCQFCRWMILSPLVVRGRIYSTSFNSHIIVVFNERPKPKMGWPDAWRVIAVMKDVLPFWNWTKMQNPGSAVCQNNSTVLSFAADAPITFRVFSRSPHPASTKFMPMHWYWTVQIYFSPKAVWKSLGQSLRLKIGSSNFNLHSITSFDCLPRLRLFMQRVGNFQPSK